MVEAQLLPKHFRSLRQHENTWVRFAGETYLLLPTDIGPEYVLGKTDDQKQSGENADDVHKHGVKVVGTVTTFAPRIYMDTSIVNHLVKTNRPEWQEATAALWQEIIEEKYPVHVSQTFFEELRKCYQPKRGQMFKRMEEISCDIHENTPEIKTLANIYLFRTRLPKEKCLQDALHIANAAANRCNVILSWNFAHMVNENFIPTYNEANRELGYNGIDLMSPTRFLKGATT